MASHNPRRVSCPSAVSRKRAASTQSVESLEQRTFLNATVVQPIDTVNGSPSWSTTINLNQTFNDPSVTGTVVLMQTSQGNIPITLYNSQVPTTVTNFLKYVTSGEYNGTVFHRVVTSGIFIVQGGGYLPDQSHISTALSGSGIPLESSVANSTGTIAMARGQASNSATSEWFFNSGDNSSTLPAGTSGG